MRQRLLEEPRVAQAHGAGQRIVPLSTPRLHFVKLLQIRKDPRQQLRRLQHEHHRARAEVRQLRHQLLTRRAVSRPQCGQTIPIESRWESCTVTPNVNATARLHDFLHTVVADVFIQEEL